MSSQIPDNLLLNEKEYDILNFTNVIFNLDDYGIKPTALCTACWRGFRCKFNLIDNKLNLKTLYVCAEDYDSIPAEFNGSIMKKKHKSELFQDLEFIENLMMFPYENVNLFINFTGKIILGYDFDNKYYIHLGLPRAYAFKELLEVIFENGILKDIRDISLVAEEIRNSLPEEFKPFIFEDEILILEKFKQKYWWLNY